MSCCARCGLKGLIFPLSADIRQSEQLFVCHGGPNRGRALTKQRLSHWVLDTITQAYRASGRPPPSGVRCHSTRSISASWAALRGVPLGTICAAASWALPSTFSMFYRVNVATPHLMRVVLMPKFCCLQSVRRVLGFFVMLLV